MLAIHPKPGITLLAVEVPEDAISGYLIKEFCFLEYRNYDRENIDYNKYSCVLRLHQVHYLYYSDVMKHFTIAIKHERPKGLAGGGMNYWTEIMLPKVIKSKDDAKIFLNGMLDFDTLHLYNTHISRRQPG